MRPITSTSRRQFLAQSSAAAAGALLGLPQAAGQNRTPPRAEVAVISHHGPEHPLLKSMVSQLLENGIYFETNEEHNLRSALPDELGGYKALLFDEPALAEVLSQTPQRLRLEEYVRNGGFVFEIEHPLEGGTRRGVNPNLLIDLVASNRAYDMIAHAGLTRFHPEMKRRLLAYPASRMLAELKLELLASLQQTNSWGEYTLHDWKAAKALLDTGQHNDMRQALAASIRQASAKMPPPAHADRVAGYFGTAWLFDETKERGPLDQARANLDEILARRPREMGVLCHGGFANDPLGLEITGQSGAVFDASSTTVRRKVFWTESLHFHAPALAAISRATGDPKYLEEAVRMIDHVSRRHSHPDGLLAHCTREGKPIAPAWGRGQTHALYGMLYTLEEMPKEHPAFQRIVARIRRTGEGLRRNQDPETGLWRNVIDSRSARLESSASIGITYVYGRCLREGWVDRKDFEPMLKRSWEGLRRLYWRRGVAANCRGTATGIDEAYYIARPQGWARMPHLVLATVEMQRLFG